MKYAAIVILLCAAAASAVDLTPTDHSGWRGWNNGTGDGWLDSWGNATDWGAGKFCDATVTQYDKVALQAAIDGVKNASGDYQAFLTVHIQGAVSATSYGTTPALVLTALTTGHPVGGVFGLNQVPTPNPFNTILGQNGWNFENDTRANAGSLFSETPAWSYVDDTANLGNSYLLSVNIGKAAVDKYLADASGIATDGFFISWQDDTADCDANTGDRTTGTFTSGTIWPGDRLEVFGRAANPMKLVILAPAAPPANHPGDANHDNIVNIIDLGILATNYDTLAGMAWEQGDFNNDGAVNIIDLGILATEYDWVGSASASVPEPMSLGLLALAGLALRRRK